MYCIYHNADLDGIFSGSIVKHFRKDVKLIGYNYGDPLPELEANEPVVICDVSLPIEQLDYVCKNSYMQTIWIDHHASAKEIFEKNLDEYKFLKYVKTSLDLTKSGCEQTWEYFFPDIPVPFLVQCIADYDVWRNTDSEVWNNITLPVQYGCRYFFKDPTDINCFYEDFPYNSQGSYVLTEFASVGNYIWDWTKDEFKRLAKNAFPGEFKELGYSCILVNSPKGNSIIFDYVEDKTADYYVVFNQTSKGYNFSVYSPFKNLDCTIVAKKYFGGGHVGAAGFKSDNFDTIITINKNEIIPED